MSTPASQQTPPRASKQRHPQVAFQAAGLGFGNATLVRVGGYLGIVLSVIGFYGALEAVVKETFGRPVIPNRLLAPHPLR